MIGTTLLCIAAVIGGFAVMAGAGIGFLWLMLRAPAVGLSVLALSAMIAAGSVLHSYGI